MPEEDANQAGFARACRVLCGGVNSPVRSFASVGGRPLIARRASGSCLWDAAGRQYVDFCLSWGVFLLGHGHPAVQAAAIAALQQGSSFGLTCPGEYELAEALLRHLQFGERVRMVSSGTEAVMTALRLARGCTGRCTVIKCDGCYHGHSDTLLVSAGSGLADLNLASSAGVPPAFTQHTISVPYNDAAAMAEAAHRHRGDLAAIIIEPVAANMGLVPPAAGYLQQVADIAHGHGALLIFDEVITGLRFDAGSAARHYGVDCDLMTLGKIIGGGHPAAAVVGPAALMEHLAPLGPVYQAGTLSGNPVAMAAGTATLRALGEPGFYRTLLALAEDFYAELRQVLRPHGVSLSSCGLMFSIFFTPQPPRCLSEVQRCDGARYGAFFRHLLQRGFYLVPSQYETNFICAAHTPEQLTQLLRDIHAFLASS